MPFGNCAGIASHPQRMRSGIPKLTHPVVHLYVPHGVKSFSHIIIGEICIILRQTSDRQFLLCLMVTAD